MENEPEVRRASVDPAREERTRHAVARVLLEQGPVSATDVAGVLGVSPAGVRRHLDALVASDQATSSAAPVRPGRGRGRPARRFRLTEPGRARFGHSYDDLAVAALRQVRELGGDAAVSEFARRRVAALTAGVPAARSEADRPAVAHHLAEVFASAGYAASARQVGSGVQLCQHHCPVAHVAAEFPQLCEAERNTFAELLGTHVQQLATIANGDSVCTTHVPTGPAPPGPPSTPTARTRSTPHHPVRNALRKELA